MNDNYQLITRGFQILTEMLAPFVCLQLRGKFGLTWWQDGVLDVLYEDQRRDLPKGGEWAALTDSLDAARCLILIDVNWNSVFKFKLSREHRNWVKELVTTRNKWAHKGAGDVSDDDAWRALDTMARLMEQIDSESTEELRELARRVRYGTSGASTETTRITGETAPDNNADQTGSGLPETTRVGLLPWRQVVEPHPDVARGRYRQAEFAADLSQVLRGTAAVEYQDPVEFFGRTYITEGMRGLLIQVAQRLSDQGGEPVIQLKTAFGGGKTHSMLALYHLFRGQASKAKMPGVGQVMAGAGLKDIPKAKVAVLVGTALDATRVRKPPQFPGISIRTLWGELAAQLAEQAGNPKLYDIVREADKASVSPGSDTLKELMDACGPCLILIDELVAYARKIYGVSGLPGGSFDNLLTFIQELSEAVRKSKNSVVVASIPESDIEIGGEAGKLALETIEHVFGRMEAIWKPVGAEEGFEIVRRRLFLNPQDPASLEGVCRAYSEMYRDNGADFPPECKELAYFERMKSCYPLHPEIFDRLYNDWAALERFQKTRGVLRLMAAVIHHLWVHQDAGLLIMPASIPLDQSIIRDELTRYLPEGWNNVIEGDVDGPRSLPFQIDQNNPRFTRVMATRRVARAVFLGSAPRVREMRVRGIEDLRVRLGTVQPGEQVSVFNDALGRMLDQLTHLYSSNQRYWYDLPPNLRRTVEDRAQQLESSPDVVDYEIETRLKTNKEKADFTRVHTCFSPSDEIPDYQEARLVILGPNDTHRSVGQDTAALQKAEEILNNRGGSPRIYRNTLAFVAPDRDLMESLKSETRRYLAWKSVLEDAEALNLDAHQRNQAEENTKRSGETVALRIKEAYCWLLVPTQDGSAPLTWESTRIGGGADNAVVKAAKKMRSAEQLITKWAPALLLMELDRWLWKEKNYISIKDLWAYLTTYCYLPRLKDEKVLMAAIQDGLQSDEFFAYAQGVSEAGRYLGLSMGSSISINTSGILVKPAAAKEQILADQAAKNKEYDNNKPTGGQQPVIADPDGGTAVIDTPTPGNENEVDPEPVKPSSGPRRFYATVTLDSDRVGRDAGRIAEEVIQHLSLLPGAKVEISLDIQYENPEGIPDNVVRTVNENCRTLKFKEFGFEES